MKTNIKISDNIVNDFRVDTVYLDSANHACNIGYPFVDGH